VLRPLYLITSLTHNRMPQIKRVWQHYNIFIGPLLGMKIVRKTITINQTSHIRNKLHISNIVSNKPHISRVVCHRPLAVSSFAKKTILSFKYHRMACTVGWCVYTKRRHGNIISFLYVTFVLHTRASKGECHLQID
jgi:hypothetical protein